MEIIDVDYKNLDEGYFKRMPSSWKIYLLVKDLPTFKSIHINNIWNKQSKTIEKELVIKFK